MMTTYDSFSSLEGTNVMMRSDSMNPFAQKIPIGAAKDEDEEIEFDALNTEGIPQTVSHVSAKELRF